MKVVALVSLILCSAYFAVWTYQSIERLQAKNDCLEGRLGVLGLLNRNNVNVRMLKGDTGDWNEEPLKKRIKKDVNSQSERGEKGRRGAPGVPGRAGYKGQKGEEGICGCTLSPPTTPKPTLAPRKLDCRISRFGIPLHLSETPTQEGSFMKDVHLGEQGMERFFVTLESTGKVLKAYNDLDSFRREQLSRYYDLPDNYQGTQHIIFNNTLIYHVANTHNIHKLHFSSERVLAVAEFSEAVFTGNQTLHTFGSSYFDISYDLNGLWVIYRNKNINDSLMLSKLTIDSLEVELTWEIELEGRSFGNFVVVCGNLYLIRHSNVIGSCIEHVYDLYTQRWSEVSLVFKVPYQHLSMAQYDPVERKVHGWDGGNMLEYVMLYN